MSHRFAKAAAAIIALMQLMISPVRGNDNGLALTPPMAWRSWNQYHGDVNQELIERIMEGMASRNRKDHLGNPTSLCDLGYCDVGLDDNWQDCGSPMAASGMNYHDVDGNPLVNLTSFPDMKKMVNHAHSLGLTAGWYGNNCICRDNCRNETECDAQVLADVKAFVKFGFDSWKLDGCGGENDLVRFNQYLKQYAKRPIMVENCHWGNPKYDPDRTLPPEEGCPYNFYRSSSDIQLSYGSVLSNLASVEKYRAANQSYPGCWAYPDMLEVGMLDGDGNFGLTHAETRSHFGAWAIVSSPLVLGHDVNNDTVTDQIWDVISNREAIAINQAYDGDSGGVYAQSNDLVKLSTFPISTSIEAEDYIFEAPAYQYLTKPLGGGDVAVLLMNNADKGATLVANFQDIPGLICQSQDCHCLVRDVWSHKTIGVLYGSYSVHVDSHDSAFLLLEAHSEMDETTSEDKVSIV